MAKMSWLPVAMLVVSPVSAVATTITFETASASPYPVGASVTDSGFVVTNIAGDMFVLVPEGCTPRCAFNGTQRLLSYGSLAPAVLLSASDDTAFSLLRFDAGESFSGLPAYWATSVLIEGTLPGGGSVSTTFSLDGINDGLGSLVDYQTFSLPNAFGSVSAVRFFGLGGTVYSEFTLDNIVIGPAVPEPATLLLLGVGLGAVHLRVAARAKRRR